MFVLFGVKFPVKPPGFGLFSEEKSVVAIFEKRQWAEEYIKKSELTCFKRDRKRNKNGQKYNKRSLLYGYDDAYVEEIKK